MHAHTLSQTLEGAQRGVGFAIFQLAGISLRDAGFLRQLLLRKAGRRARIDHDLDDETSPSRASALTRS